VVTGLLSAGLCVALVPPLELTGAALATDVAYAFYVGAHFWLCRKLIALPMRPIALDLARCALAAVAMGGVMALFGTGRLNALEIVLGGIAGVVTYVAALLATRAVTVAELRAARDAVARKFGHRPAVEPV
jgi:peptidoglycan biosynthesis protein MviN/MurJ (putative lipid II flippase)